MTAEAALENQFSDLRQLDTNRNSPSILFGCAPHITDDVLQQIVDEARAPVQDRTANVDGRPFASSPFRRLAIRGLFFLCGILIWWPLLLVV